MGLFDRAELTRSRFLYGPEVHDDYAVWHMNEQIPAGYGAAEWSRVTAAFTSLDGTAAPGSGGGWVSYQGSPWAVPDSTTFFYHTSPVFPTDVISDPIDGQAVIDRLIVGNQFQLPLRPQSPLGAKIACPPDRLKRASRRPRRHMGNVGLTFQLKTRSLRPGV
ncbi:MAG: hypothetical protein JJU19_03825 [Pararhodobacter sp.]|nr:hypothetical protein [Pararhodobacter sp.]